MEKIKQIHPEKVKNPINPIKKKPEWIRSKLSDSKEFFLTKTVVNQNNLVTVCQEANCPNITECWSKSCLLYTSPSPRDCDRSRMPSSA